MTPSPAHSLLTEELDDSLAVDPSLWEELRGQHVFISGGTGFFGRWLLETYVHAWQRLGLDGRVTVLTRDPEAFAARAPHLARHPAITLHRGDQASFELPSARIDLLIHAALAYGQPWPTLTANLDGTRRLLLLAGKAGARRVLFTSSGAVYGKQPAELARLDEEHGGAPPLTADGAYGEMKRAGELMGTLWGDGEGRTFLIARCFAFVGPYLPLEGGSAIGNFIRDALGDGPVVVRGDGLPVRSYLYASDMARWLWTILLRGRHARPYNVGSEDDLPLAQVAAHVRDVLAPGRELRVLGIPDESKLRNRYVPSTRRAREELGLQQTVPLTEAIARTARYLRRVGGVSRS